MRRGGFGTREEAEKARENAQDVIREGVDPSNRIKTGKYLTEWLAGRVDLKPTTRHNYKVSIDTYLIPLLGHLELQAIQPLHISRAFDTIRDWNDQLAGGNPVRQYQRHVGPAAMQRIRNVLRSALRDAVRSRLVIFNAAEHVPMEASPAYKPAVWTVARIRKFWSDYEVVLERSPLTRGDRAFLVWRSMGLRPFPVMVWIPDDLGAFLDYSAGHRMAPLFELAAGTGMRRGELCGLPWTDVDLDAGVIHVTTARVQAGWEVVKGGPKTDAGHREVPLIARNVTTLKAWRRVQAAEQIKLGADWPDTGLVFTDDEGRPWHPDAVTDAFERQAFAAHLPPVRLHDVRHAHIGEMIALGINERIISDRVGHSGSKMTRDYAAVAAEVSREAAERVSALIPRRAQR
jgi:integrase